MFKLIGKIRKITALVLSFTLACPPAVFGETLTTNVYSSGEVSADTALNHKNATGIDSNEAMATAAQQPVPLSPLKKLLSASSANNEKSLSQKLQMQVLNLNALQREVDYLNEALTQFTLRHEQQDSFAKAVDPAQLSTLKERIATLKSNHTLNDLLASTSAPLTSSLERFLATYFNAIKNIAYLDLVTKAKEFTSITEFTQNWSLILSFETLKALWPSREALPASLDVTPIDSGRSFSIKLDPSLILGEVLKDIAKNFNNESKLESEKHYLRLVKCLSSTALIQNLATLRALQLRMESPLAKNVNEVCPYVSQSELYNIAYRSATSGNFDNEFRSHIIKQGPSLSPYMSSQLIKMLSEKLAPTKIISLANRPQQSSATKGSTNVTLTFLPLISVYHIFYLNPGLFEDIDQFIDTEKSMSKRDFSDYLSEMEDAFRLYNHQANQDTLSLNSFFEDHGLIRGALKEVLADSSLGEFPDLRDSQTLAKYLREGELLFFYEAWREIITKWPTSLYEQVFLHKEDPGFLLTELIQTAKKNALKAQLIQLFETSVTKGSDLDGQQIANQFFESEIEPALELHLNELKQNGFLQNLAKQYVDQARKSFLNETQLMGPRTSYVAQLVQSSLEITKIMDAKSTKELPYNEQVLLIAMGDSLNQMGPKVSEVIQTIYSETNDFSVKKKMADEARLITREKIGTSLEACPGEPGALEITGRVIKSIFSLDSIYSYLSKPFTGEEQAKVEEREKQNQFYCDVDKATNWMGYQHGQKPNSLFEIIDQFEKFHDKESLDPLTITTESLVKKYKELLRSIEYIKYRPLAAEIIDPTLGGDKSKRPLYELLALMSKELISGDQVQKQNMSIEDLNKANGPTTRLMMNLADKALKQTSENIFYLLGKVEKSNQSEDLKYIIKNSNFIASALGNDSKESSLQHMMFRQGQLEIKMNSNFYPAMLKVHDQVRSRLTVTEDPNEVLWDGFFENSMSGWHYLLAYWAVSFTLGRVTPGLTGVVKTFSTRTSGIINGYFGFTIGTMATDIGVMISQRLPRLEGDLTELERTSLTEAHQPDSSTPISLPSMLKADNYLLNNWYIEKEMNAITSITWNPIDVFTGAWGRIAQSGFFLGVPVVALSLVGAYNVTYGAYRLKKHEASLKRASKNQSPSPADLSFEAKYIANVKKSYNVRSVEFRENFRLLGINGYSWNPIEWKAALDRVRLTHSSPQFKMAESAYEELILNLARDFSQFDKVTKINRRGAEVVVREELEYSFQAHVKALYSRLNNAEINETLKVLNQEAKRISKKVGG